jgi:hypothetical protein
MSRGIHVVIAMLVAGSTLAACATNQPSGPGGRTVSREAGRSPLTAPPSGAESPPIADRSGRGTFTPKPPATGTGIAGVTLVDGHCPVLTDPPCADRPVKAHLSIVNASGTVVATVESGADGQFSVATLPGRYTIKPIDVDGGPPRGLTSMDVTVQAGKYTSIELLFRSGVK